MRMLSEAKRFLGPFVTSHRLIKRARGKEPACGGVLDAVDGTLVCAELCVTAEAAGHRRRALGRARAARAREPWACGRACDAAVRLDERGGARVGGIGVGGGVRGACAVDQ